MKHLKFLLVFAVSAICMAFNAGTTYGFDGLSIKDLDPTNKDSAVRKKSKELDPTNKNSAVRKDAKELDPFNKNSAVRKGAKELDPFNKNSGLRKGVKEADPFNRNSAAGKYIRERKKTLQNEYHKQEQRINRSIGATTERFHKTRRDLQTKGQITYENIRKETNDALKNVYQHTEAGVQRATSDIHEAEQKLHQYRREHTGSFEDINAIFEAAENASPGNISKGVQSISIDNFKKGVQKLPVDIVNSSPVKTAKQWGERASVENISKGFSNSFQRLGSSSEMQTVRRWRDQGGESADTAGQFVDKRIIRPAIDGTMAAGKFVDENITQPLVADQLTGMLNSDLIVYNFTTTGSFTVNLSTGAYWMRVDLPMGMVVDSTDFENWLQGNLSIPNFDPIEIATQGTITNRNNYGGFRSQYPGNMTYVSSKRFVDWFSLETAANELLQAYFTAGQSAQSSLEAARKYFVLEWNDLYAWLESQGLEYVEDVSLNLFQSIISGQPFRTKTLGISATIVEVPYTYELDVNLDSRLASVLDQVGVNVPGGGHILANSPHLAFVVTLHGLENSQERQDKMQRLEQIISRGPQSLDNILHTALLDSSYPAINAMFTGGRIFSDPIGSTITDAIFQQTGMANFLGQKKAFLSSPVDLRDSQVGSNIKGLIGSMTFGNQGTARLSKLELDLDSFQLTCEIELVHKHSWGSLKEIQSGLSDFARTTGKDFNIEKVATLLVGR